MADARSALIGGVCGILGILAGGLLGDHFATEDGKDQVMGDLATMVEKFEVFTNSKHDAFTCREKSPSCLSARPFDKKFWLICSLHVTDIDACSAAWDEYRAVASPKAWRDFWQTHDHTDDKQMTGLREKWGEVRDARNELFRTFRTLLDE